MELPSPVWLLPPLHLTLQPQEIHLWVASLDNAASLYSCFFPSLSLDEQQRAKQFRRIELQHRFVCARGILRAILARYLRCAPADLQFGYSDRGKPFLAIPDKTGLDFNLSHSQGIALYAIARTQRVGIDLEHLRQVADLEALTRRFFLPPEHERIQSLPEEQRQHRFFQFWTAKEAVLKALGEGLIGLETVEIGLEKGTTRLLRLGEGKGNDRPQPTTELDWILTSFLPAEGYVATLAAEGKEHPLRFWQWAHQAGEA